jgi:hypothetical protein
MSVKRAKQEIDSFEFTQWMAYSHLEPFGEQIADLRHGTAVATLANINRDAEKRPEPYKAEDFIWWSDAGASNAESDEPVLLDDPVAHANLLRASLFGIKPA